MKERSQIKKNSPYKNGEPLEWRGNLCFVFLLKSPPPEGDIARARIQEGKKQAAGWRRMMEKNDGVPTVAVAINKDKSSQNALKWAIENLVSKGQPLTLLHIDTLIMRHSLQINCSDVVVEDHDVARGIIEYVSNAGIEKLVLGAPSRTGFMRGSHGKLYTDLQQTETDISFISSGRPSIDRAFPTRLSNHSDGHDHSFDPARSPFRSGDSYSFGNEFSSTSGASSATSWSSQNMVEVLSCIRHPHMVLLLGACPEYGCLVYEYMANGSLDDRLFRRGNTPPIPWQDRFRIAAEIATGLLFLHQTKPEPLVHRDLKPGNILLDRNYVSKIGDVGLARLIPPSVADSVTQYRMTSAAGTFCYIDPEYQQTGMLGVKSDIYSLGIMLLQIITAKPPMGLAHHVSAAIEKGIFSELLDQTVIDWPVEEAIKFARIALKCAELRRKDRPDLATVVLPELERLRSLGEEEMQYSVMNSAHNSPMNSQVFTMGDHHMF